MADGLGVRIFSAEIIYHLFDAFTKYREDYKKQKQDEFKYVVCLCLYTHVKACALAFRLSDG